MQEWQKRRLVCTKSKLYIALLGEDLVRDSIPLSEVSSIEIMRDSSHAPIQTKKSLRDSFLSKALEREESMMAVSAFQIRTVADGFNSGRIYYFQVDSKEERDATIEKIRIIADGAKIKAVETSRYIKFQILARTLYESTPFQILSTSLIILVSDKFGESCFFNVCEDTIHLDPCKAAFAELCHEHR